MHVRTALALCAYVWLGGSMTACVSGPAHSRALKERDQLRELVAQAETTLTQQKNRTTELQAELTRAQELTRELRERIGELESMTADQALSAEALTEKLDAAAAQREALLSQMAELEERLARTPPSSAPEGGVPPTQDHALHERQVTEALQPLLAARRAAIDAGGERLVISFAAPALFGPSGPALTPDGRQLLAKLAELTATLPVAQVRVRVVRPSGASGSDEERAAGMRGAWDRAMAAARPFESAGASPPEVAVAGAGDSVQIDEKLAADGLVQIMLFWKPNTAPHD